MSPELRFSDFCKAHGYKATQHRCAVVKELFAQSLPVTAEDLVAKCKEGGVARATVSRTLRLLLEAGMVSKYENDRYLLL